VTKIDGGGDSFFIALLMCLNDLKYDVDSLDVPDNELVLRERLVDELVEHAAKFNIKCTKDIRKSFKAMRKKGQLPREELISVACELFQVEVWVHHGMQWPVVYRRANYSQEDPKIHLQCISGIHYNPVTCRIDIKDSSSLVNNNLVNLVNGGDQEYTRREVKPTSSCEPDTGVICCSPKCKHDPPAGVNCILEIGNRTICALIDTGSQVSLIGQGIVESLKEDNQGLEFDEVENNVVVGIDGTKTTLKGAVQFDCKIQGFEMTERVPFAIVKDDDMPCCCLLGANFLIRNRILLDCHNLCIAFKNSDERCITCAVKKGSSRNKTISVNRVGFASLAFTISTASDYADEEEFSSDVNSDSRDNPVNFVFSKGNIQSIQNKDLAIRTLKRKLSTLEPVQFWKQNCLFRFKRHVKCLSVRAGTVFKRNNQSHVPVVPFMIMVDIIFKIHNQVAHVGIRKILKIVEEQFWHPAVNSIVRDVCVSCPHCQRYKSSSQLITPPVLKIQPAHPFDLVALDLLQFPRSSRGNIVLLVAIDHSSKFLIAVPLRNKTAHTVSEAFKSIVLPSMIRIPNRILTDNGPEF
jgi:hypothetical protein